MKKLKLYNIINYTTLSGISFENLNTSYQIIGAKLHTAPIVLIIHALTGNSDVSSKEKGWWKEIVGAKKLINTNKYTVLSINILGNGYDDVFIDNYKAFTAKDIAILFKLVLNYLNISNLHTVIGGSLGGGIAWELTALYPKLSKNVIPIASDWKATDWIIGQTAIQESILLNSSKPIQDARKIAMLLYRTPHSINNRFERTKTSDKQLFNIESWLNYHGKKLETRYELKAYLMMNHLLGTIAISDNENTFKEILKPIQSKIIQIAITSDLFFIKDENIKTKRNLDELNIKNEYHEIKSDVGHDAFLIEHQQITNFLTPIFK